MRSLKRTFFRAFTERRGEVDDHYTLDVDGKPGAVTVLSSGSGVTSGEFPCTEAGVSGDEYQCPEAWVDFGCECRDLVWCEVGPFGLFDAGECDLARGCCCEIAVCYGLIECCGDHLVEFVDGGWCVAAGDEGVDPGADV